MTHNHPLIETLLNEEYANKSVPQIIFEAAQPFRNEPKPLSIDELASILTELAARRAYFQGIGGFAGELNNATNLLMGPTKTGFSEPVQNIYQHKQTFLNQLDKTTFIIKQVKQVNHRFFTRKNLEKNFGEHDGTYIHESFLMSLTEEERIALEGKKWKPENTSLITREELQSMPIDVDAYTHRNSERVTNVAAYKNDKYGKRADSLSTKSGFYTIDKLGLEFMNKKKGAANIVDPSFPIYFYCVLKDEELEAYKNYITGFFASDDEETTMQQLQDIRKSYRLLKKEDKNAAKREKEYIEADKIFSEKNFNKMKRIVASNIRGVSQTFKEDFLKTFYDLTIKEIKDNRGLQGIFNTFESIADKAYLITRNTDKYIADSIEIHSPEIDGRNYSAIHGKWKPELFGEVEQYEIQLLNINGLILDIFGPDNNFKYHKFKQFLKYKDISKGQEGLAMDFTRKMKRFSAPAELAFNALVETITSRYGVDEMKIRTKAYEEAIRLYEKLYK